MLRVSSAGWHWVRAGSIHATASAASHPRLPSAKIGSVSSFTGQGNVLTVSCLCRPVIGVMKNLLRGINRSAEAIFVSLFLQAEMELNRLSVDEEQLMHGECVEML